MGILTKYGFRSRPDIEGYLLVKGGKVTFHNLLYVVRKIWQICRNGQT
jgi:hypothetical protein